MDRVMGLKDVRLYSIQWAYTEGHKEYSTVQGRMGPAGQFSG